MLATRFEAQIEILQVEITKLKSDAELGRTTPQDRDVANKNWYDLTQSVSAATIVELAARVSDLEGHRGEVVYTNHDDRLRLIRTSYDG